jgi:uncharacterized membrane protein YkvA (DUF1232 family)
MIKPDGSDFDGPDFDSGKLRDDEALVAKSFWDKLRKTLGRIPFIEDALAAYYCASDKATPLYVRAVLMGALAYFIIPSDVIPDFIVGLGFTDDASVLAAAMAAVHTALKPDHYDAARRFLDKEAADAGDEEE